MSVLTSVYRQLFTFYVLRFTFQVSRLHQRQFYGKATPSALSLPIPHVAPVRAGNLAGECQAKPRALDAAAQRIMGAEKLLEYLLFAARRHAEAAVEHTQLGAVAIRRELDFDLFAFAGIF